MDTDITWTLLADVRAKREVSPGVFEERNIGAGTVLRSSPKRPLTDGELSIVVGGLVAQTDRGD